ncbi:type IA DNA topoisomerase [Microvirga puerhi]|uniref:DNA topoisomerase n=1 Tax=Microvirga puerhi TaxID=2876078 RepID=A0ABS7VTL5_9HYPH|nr:DNA topoisomerase [Microvirga puerhi]MBZ6078911.1 DNA topoisomerase III [Microvirga puerhi]
MKLIICEKPLQAKNMMAALGSQPGITILPAEGHLFRLAEPGEVNTAWETWTDDVLVPPDGFYPKVPDKSGGKSSKLQRIREAAKSASSIVIATDCDREGQAIADDILKVLKFKGPVLRAMFTAEDKKSLLEAVRSAKPNTDYAHISRAAEARRQADQIYNLTLTRVGSRHLRPSTWKPGKPVGIGRVKTPTFGIVCARELEIRQFVSRPYYSVWATIHAEGHNIRLRHDLSGRERIFDRSEADTLTALVSRWAGTVSCKKEAKIQSPENPLDITTLLARASKVGLDLQKTVEVAQSLYEKHKIITYPRGESRYLPEALIDDAAPLLKVLQGLYPATAGWSPNIRKGKSGVFSDAGNGGASHHAIIPNVNVADQFATIYAELNNDERKLFDLIALSYLAAIGPDHHYDQTVIKISVATPSGAETFKTTGRVVTSPGWKAILPSSLASDDDSETEEDDQVSALPMLTDGASGHATGSGVAESMTKPPSRIKPGDLPKVMKEAWKFVPEGEERERLKKAEGIGMPGTRPAIVEGLIRQGWLLKEKGFLVPSAEALDIYLLFREKVPAIVDIGFTARMEMRLDAVLEGKISAEEVVNQIVRTTGRIVEIVIASGNGPVESAVGGPRAPSDKMIALAQKMAASKNVSLPEGYNTDFSVCKTFLDAQLPKDQNAQQGPRPASEKAIEFAKGIEARTGKKIPEAALKDGIKLSKWIDTNKGR